MDNLTHSIVGLAVGELLHRSLPQETDARSQRLRRRLFLIACWAASNFPDLDLALAPLLRAPLGYLLYHRGPTHTLLYAIPQALLLWTMIWLCWPPARRLMKESRHARTGAAAALGIGLTLHLLMDYLNSYGIHPFHPFDSRWFYGDMIFIVEPLFWIALGVPLAMTVQRPALKVALLAVLAAVLLFFASAGFLTWASLAALALAGIALAALQHSAGARGRSALLAGFVLGIGFVIVQGMASEQAQRVVAASLQKESAGNRLLDVALTPFPANPLCWNFVAVESSERAATFTLRRGMLSLLPDMLPVAACPRRLSGRPFRPGATAAVAFLSEEQGSLAALRMLKNTNCHVEAWLRFARTPAFTATEAFDLRFGAEPRQNFTTLHFAEFMNRECPHPVPDWGFPRADLLASPVSAPAR